MAGVSSCMKYSMFVFNFLFWLCGSIILGVSIWIRVSKDAQEELEIDSSLFAGVNLLIAVGSIIMILGFLGCCGAVKESRCMLLLFFIGLLLILILQVTGGILGAVSRSQVETVLNLTLMVSVDELKSSTEDSKAFQEKFQKFERENKCCGMLNGPTDWGDNFKNPSGSYKICQCELEKPSQDLCTNYQDRYVYKTMPLCHLSKNYCEYLKYSAPPSSWDASTVCMVTIGENYYGFEARMYLCVRVALGPDSNNKPSSFKSKDQIGGKLKFSFKSGHGCIGSSLAMNDYEVKPCGEVIIKYFKDNLVIIIGITFGLAVIEILGLVFSMSLYCQIRRK